MLHLLPTLLVLLTASWLPLARAVFVNFENCLEKVWLRDAAQSPYLQFTPLYVWATFDTLNPNHRLNVTVYGTFLHDDALDHGEGSANPLCFSR